MAHGSIPWKTQCKYLQNFLNVSRSGFLAGSRCGADQEMRWLRGVGGMGKEPSPIKPTTPTRQARAQVQPFDVARARVTVAGA